MKIEKVKKNKQVSFSTLNIGDCFYLDGSLYMKIDCEDVDKSAIYYSESLFPRWFLNEHPIRFDTMVSPVTSKLIIEE